MWTDENMKTLVEMWEAGGTATEIATQFGTTRNAVLGKLHRISNGKMSIYKRPKGTQARKRASVSATQSIRHRIPRRVIIKPGSYVRREVTAPAPRVPNVIFLDRRADQCAYITSDAGVPVTQIRCCGASQREGSSYCAFHYLLCYKPTPTNRIRLPKDVALARKLGFSAAQALGIDFERDAPTLATE